MTFVAYNMQLVIGITHELLIWLVTSTLKNLS